MECLRNDESREVNHHGTAMEVNGDQKLFKKSNKIMDDENIRMEATRIMNIDRSRSSFYMKLGEIAAMKGIPIVIVTFSSVYWSYGLYHYFYPAI